MLTRQRMSRIYYDRKFFHYPLKPLNALANLGPLTSAKVVASYAHARLKPIEPERSFRDWITNRFGRRLFEIFFKSYTEKVWGISCDELSADWAAQRIKGMSLTSAVKDAVLGKRGGKVVKSLIEEFRYPPLGPGMMWERAAEQIRAWGGTIRMDAQVVELRHRGDHLTSVLVRDSEGKEERLHAEHFISSMPLRELGAALTPQPEAAVREAAAGLAYRDFLTVVLIIDEPELFPDNWIYIHDPDVLVGRLQNFKNWSPAMVPDPSRTCIGMEYFCDAGDALWTRPDAELIALGTEELDRLGLARAADVRDGTVVRMPFAYPVYDDHYKERVDTLRRWLEGHAHNLQLIGRAGMHRYNNQDHSMMTALLAARNLMGGAWDLWKVNTDAEYHEEQRGS
jgi:protoporphyrinogen oxidase